MFNKEPFVVPHETICIDGEWFDLEDIVHCVIEGQEYIWLDDQCYELNDSVLGDPVEINEDYEDEDDVPEQYEPPRSSGCLTKIAIVLVIIFILVLAGPEIMNTLNYAGSAVSNVDVSPVLSSVAETGDKLSESVWKTKTSDVVDAMDYTNPTTRDYALSLIDKEHGGNYNIEQICDMWEKIDGQWTYVNDPKGDEYYSPASRTINLSLKGDCDDFAIVMASSLLAIGGTPRVILASNKNKAGHAYAEVYIAKNKKGLQKIGNYICKRYNCKKIAYRTSEKNGQTRYWLNLDWSSKHPGGPYYQNDGTTIAVYQDKHWSEIT
ncbi:hypothetical protein J2128_002112 [Methanomicrobium sp. W14]|uniref:transglutaminase domain-containing protein n=1 Tax=Methanomicrobium sp. W14 TaxID=2817839 RepID=UPI001AE2C6E4|nr:transglutaminase domain-containing protein [Methanomicrobium sp. W14]MBP2134146.1 hypothetical protein [Methanomicrobium sp. W14]